MILETCFFFLPYIFPFSPHLPFIQSNAILISFLSKAMEPHHAHRADRNHSDENLNLVFAMYSRLLFQALEAMDPPHSRWAYHRHSNEILNQMYTIPEQPLRPDSGYHETHSRPPRKLQVVNTTPTPPPTPTSIPSGLFPQDEESRALAARRAEECEWSSGWEADSESEEGSLERICMQDEKKQDLLRACPSEKQSNGKNGNNNNNNNNNKNIFSRGLQTARQCIGAAVMATGRKISPSTSLGAENCGRVGGLDGEVGDKKGWNGRRSGDDEESAFGKAVRRVKRSTMFWKSEPVRLRPAKVRMVLD